LLLLPPFSLVFVVVLHRQLLDTRDRVALGDDLRCGFAAKDFDCWLERRRKGKLIRHGWQERRLVRRLSAGARLDVDREAQ